MEWQSSANPQGGWYADNCGNIPYASSFGQPPPPPGQYWGAYGTATTATYPNYPQAQWAGYQMAPNYSVPPPPTTVQMTSTNTSYTQPPINPPLPPDPPPPAEPPKAEAEKAASPTEPPKVTPPLTPITSNNFTTSTPSYGSYPYSSYNNTGNWYTGVPPPPVEIKNKPDFNKHLPLTPIKFELGKKDVTNSAKESITGKSATAGSMSASPIYGKTNNNKKSGKFNQMSFTKGENLGEERKLGLTTEKPKVTPDVPKKPINMLQPGDWPESLKRYVGKCFSRCVTELDKDQVEICLKGKLTQSAHSGSLWEKNWDKETLINVHSQAIESPAKDTENKLYQSDLSRGFIVRKRSPSHDENTDYNKRCHTTADENFLPLSKRFNQGKKRGKKRKNMMSNENQIHNNNSNPFYSKMGAKNSFGAEKEFGSCEMMQKRAARFAGAESGGPQSKKNVKQNRLGPKKKMNLMASINVTFSGEETIDWEAMHIVGTCTTLEKQFLRLTAAPDPCTVRTPATLKRALEHAKKRWQEKADYRLTCNQLKSIRQDLTVQGIRNVFTIQVYETHCRVALEKGDHEEFNQCQSQLKQLYSEIGGDNVMEFTAYRLLYYIYTKNTLDITSLIAGLSDKDKTDTTVQFALQVRVAWSLRNYYKFFSLYRKAPLMSGFLMDWFIERERKNAIKIIARSYRPGSVDVSFVRSCLAIDVDDDWNKFAEMCALKFTDATMQLLDCKATVLAI